MNSKNKNFLEEEIEYEEVPADQVSDADEIIEEIEDEIEAEARVSEQTMKALSEAEKRIEQANLYKAILNSNLFAQGSARPEIIKIVDKEFKEFVMYRLEVLLGIKSDGGVRPAQEQAQQVFTQIEINALKDIARRLSKQAPAPAQTQQLATPVVQQVTANSEPTVQQVTQPTATTQTKMVKRVVKRTVVGQPQQAKATKRRPESNNIGAASGQDLSQAVAADRPPVKMPSQTQIDMMNAQQAEKNARAKGGESPALAHALTSILKGG